MSGSKRNYRLRVAAAVVGLPLLFGSVAAGLATADTGSGDSKSTSSKQGGPAASKSKIVAKPAPKARPGKPSASQELPAVPGNGEFRPAGVDYPSYLPDLTPAQQLEVAAKLSEIPAALRPTLLPYVVNSVVPFAQGRLLAPNPRV